MYTLLNMHKPPAEGIFYDGDGKVRKPTIVEGYSWHMLCIDKGDRVFKN
jgi:hypothetical protein